jgi:UrcA family protein
MMNFVSRAALSSGAAVLLMVGALSSAALPASATALSTAERRVGYGDLDLQRAEGVTALRGRVAVAAAEVCAELYAQRFVERHQRRACVNEARSNTSPHIARVVRQARR